MEQDTLNLISSYASKLLRQNFGKGPQSCQTTINRNFVVVYIRGFISPMEEALLTQGQRNEVEKARNFIITPLMKELKGMVQITLDCEIEGIYHDWNFPNNSGVIIFIIDQEFNQALTDSTVNLSLLEKEVARISMLVQKIPDQIFITPISPTIYLIERVGILIRIEQSLIEKGFEEELKITKDELEKKYFHHHGKFHEIFNRSVRDIFIDWDLRDDKSMMAFILD
ncbi:Na-translocating system protein MpsC family protein [Bacillus sp. AK128]